MAAPPAVADTVTPDGTPQTPASTRTGTAWPAAATNPWPGESTITCGVPEHVSAFPASSRPELALVPASAAGWSAVFRSSALTAAGVAAGCAASTSAAAPATYGLAIDVPLSDL